MPASQHEAFVPLDDITTPIWRYMDFTKFVAMLNSRTLYFSRADLLGDPFEGSLPSGIVQLHAEMAEAMTRHAGAKGAADQMATYAHLRQHLRRCVYVNCWHANHHESAAMWKLYGKIDDAVAIKSTYQSLGLALSEDVILGRVDYIDYNTSAFPVDNLLYPFAHKRKSFEHEREVRAVIRDLESLRGLRKGVIPPDGIPLGIAKAIQLHLLVHEVYVAPTASAWFCELVEAMCVKHSLTNVLPVRRSSLNAAPFY